MGRATNESMSVFSINGASWLADLKDCGIDMDTDTKESKAINSGYKYPWPVCLSMKVSGKLFQGDAGNLANLWGTSQPLLLTTGAGSYSGNFLIKLVKHQIKDEDLQMQDVTLESQGLVTVS